MLLLAHSGELPEPARLWSDGWTLLPGVILVTVLAVAWYARRWRAAFGGDRRGLRMTACLGAAAILLVALQSPLDALAEGYLASAHMVQHMLLGDLVPALAMFAAAGGVFAAGGIRSRPRLRALVRASMHPAAVLAVWIGTWYMWHVPTHYEAALAVPAIHIAEHLAFLAAGAVFWHAVVDPFGLGRSSIMARIGLAVAVLAAGALLSNAMTFVDDPWYLTYAAQPTRLFGWSPMADQQYAGLVMLAMQVPTLGVLFVGLIREHLTEQARARPSQPLTTEHPLVL